MISRTLHYLIILYKCKYCIQPAVIFKKSTAKLKTSSFLSVTGIVHVSKSMQLTKNSKCTQHLKLSPHKKKFLRLPSEFQKIMIWFTENCLAHKSPGTQTAINQMRNTHSWNKIFPCFDAHYPSEQGLRLNHHVPARTVPFPLILTTAVVPCQGGDVGLSEQLSSAIS